MALSVASGSFLTPTSADSAFAVTGVGFQGKLLLLWGGRHATGLGHHTDAQLFLGAAASSTSRWCCGTQWQDNQGTALTHRTQNLDACYRELTIGTTTTVINADFVSWDSDGFTLDVDVADATASRVFYLVLGGSDITNVALGTYDVAASQIIVSSLSFQPNLLLLASAQNSVTNAGVEGNSTQAAMTFGMARSTSEEWTAGAKSQTGATSPGGHGIMRSDVPLFQIIPTGTTADKHQNFTSFNSDGFTLGIVAAANATAVGVLYIALAGTYQAKLGTFTQRSGTGTQAVTGVGFMPEMLLFGTASRVVNTSTTVDPRLGLGVALSASNRRVATMAEDNNDPSITDSSASESVCIRHLTAGTPTVDAEADLDTMDSDGFTLDWTTADSTAREHGYLAMASGAAVAPSRKALTLLGVS
jgi:hypothetical protein